MKMLNRKIKTIVLVLLICSLSFAFQQFSNINAQTTPTLEEKATAFLTNVIGLDLTKYNVTVTTGPSNDQPSPFNVSFPFEMKGINYHMTSDYSTMNIGFSFENGLLNFCLITNSKGSPIYLQEPPATTFDSTKGFMQKYEMYIAKFLSSDVTDLQTINNLISTSPKAESLPKIVDNIKFESSSDSHGDSYKWTFTQNELEFSQKRIELDFKNGTIRSLYDGWNLFSVGTTNAISKEQAISLAFPAAQNFTLRFNRVYPIYGTDQTVIGQNETEVDIIPDLKNAKITADLEMSGRDASSSTIVIYPLWVIDFTFEKPISNVDGITVTVWGDTGQIASCQADVHLGTLTADDSVNPTLTPEPATTGIQPTAIRENSNIPVNIVLIAGVVAIVALTIAAIVMLNKRKN
jgi:hypothetical protein